VALRALGSPSPRRSRDSGDVFLNYHSDDAAAQDAAAQVEAGGGRPHLIKADVGTPDGCAAVIAAARRTTDHLGQIVHCAVDAYSTTALGADPARFARAVITNGASLLFVVQRRCRCLPAAAPSSS
jgi:enoyl-[acyl-carrier protein] reductase III